MVQQTEERRELKKRSCFGLEPRVAKSVHILDANSGVRIELADGSVRQFIFGPESLYEIQTYDSKAGQEVTAVTNPLQFGNLEGMLNEMLRESGTGDINFGLYDEPIGGPAYGPTHHWVDFSLGGGKYFETLGGDIMAFKFMPVDNPIQTITDATKHEKITYVLK